MRRTAITAYLYSAAIASGLLLVLSPWSRMDVREWINGVLLVLVVLGSAYTVFTLVTERDGARYSAWALGAYSGVMLLHHAVVASMGNRSDAGPALVLSYMVIWSLWGALVVGMLLVLRLRSTARPPLRPASELNGERDERLGDQQAHLSTARHPPIPWIEHLRSVQLAEKERRDRRTAAWLHEHGALLLFGTIGSEGYLRPDGTTWVHEAENWGEPGELRMVWRQVHGTERWAVLTIGKKHFPEVAQLLPERSETAEDCRHCGGSGLVRFGSGPLEPEYDGVICWVCGGLGWVEQDTVDPQA